jgi:hypothetical protein
MQKTILILLSVFSLVFLSGKSRLSSSPAAVEPAAGILSISEPGNFIRKNFEDSLRRLYDHIGLNTQGLNYDVFRLGMIGYYNLRSEGKLSEKNIFSIIDFSKASTEKRFYTIDLENRKLQFHSYVAHGRNTGENFAKSFSNKQHSNQSSLGFYVTGETYVGSKGYSLRLDGKEENYNGNIRDRAVVIHDADYVSEAWIQRYGRLGRSQGCPALPKEVSREIINTIKDKTAIFAYYPDEDYLQSSAYLDIENLMQVLEEGSVNPNEKVVSSL